MVVERDLAERVSKMAATHANAGTSSHLNLLDQTLDVFHLERLLVHALLEVSKLVAVGRALEIPERCAVRASFIKASDDDNSLFRLHNGELAHIRIVNENAADATARGLE